jgi:hypothetical protein
MNNVVHVSEMCSSMVAKVDIGEAMAKTLLRRKHVASPAGTIAPAVVDCLLRLRGGCVFRADAICEFQLRPGRGSQQKS